ncbi:MAG TPA: hypothetical protein VMH22_14210 [bacterium]|nr:hypothetical protein [bacterium]
MRTVALVTVIVALASLSCAGHARVQTSTTNTKWPKEALETLTPDELAQFIKALPAFSGALKAAKWSNPNTKEVDDQLGTLSRMVESMNVPGINDSLRPYGGWTKVRPTLYKVFAATAAVFVGRQSPQFIEGLKQDTTERGRHTLKNFEFFKTVCAQIPESNKQLVAQHQNDLQPLGSLGN